MSTTSSAEPASLIRYQTTLQPIDVNIITAANPLASTLAHFAATCTEYRIHVDDLPDEMRAHGRRAETTNTFVGEVGKKFLWADSSMGMTSLQPATQVDREVGRQVGELGEKGLKGWDYLETFAQAVLIAFSRLDASARNVIFDLPDSWRTLPKSPTLLRKLAGFSPTLNKIGLHKLSTAGGNVWVTGVGVGLAILKNSGMQDKSMFFSASFVDVGIFLAGHKISTLVKGKMMVLVAKTLAIGAFAGKAALAGALLVVTIKIAVLVVAVVAVGFAIDWAIKKYGLRDKAVAFVDKAVTWITDPSKTAGEKLLEGAAAVDDYIFRPVSNAIVNVREAIKNQFDREAQQLAIAMQNVQRAAAGILAPEVLVPAVEAASPMPRQTLQTNSLHNLSARTPTQSTLRLPPMAVAGPSGLMQGFLTGLNGGSFNSPQEVLQKIETQLSRLWYHRDGIGVAKNDFELLKESKDGAKVGTIARSATIKVLEEKQQDGETWVHIRAIGLQAGKVKTRVPLEGWVRLGDLNQGRAIEPVSDLPGTKIPSKGYLRLPFDPGIVAERTENNREIISQMWGENGEIASGNRYPYGHRGIDFRLASSTQLYSVDSDGEIIEMSNGWNDGYGNTVRIKYSWGTVRYSHLSEFDPELKKQFDSGEKPRVKAGCTIGTSGSTGNSEAPHLDFEIIPDGADTTDNWGGRIDPLPYFDPTDYQKLPSYIDPKPKK